jgi:hypothetical protein
VSALYTTTAEAVSRGEVNSSPPVARTEKEAHRRINKVVILHMPISLRVTPAYTEIGMKSYSLFQKKSNQGKEYSEKCEDQNHIPKLQISQKRLSEMIAGDVIQLLGALLIRLVNANHMAPEQVLSLASLVGNFIFYKQRFEVISRIFRVEVENYVAPLLVVIFEVFVLNHYLFTHSVTYSRGFL